MFDFHSPPRSGRYVITKAVARNQVGSQEARGADGQTRDHPLYTTMILAWSITEIIRYGFYECALLGVDIPALTWARYVSPLSHNTPTDLSPQAQQSTTLDMTETDAQVQPIHGPIPNRSILRSIPIPLNPTSTLHSLPRINHLLPKPTLARTPVPTSFSQDQSHEN